MQMVQFMRGSGNRTRSQGMQSLQTKRVILLSVTTKMIDSSGKFSSLTFCSIRRELQSFLGIRISQLGITTTT